MKVSSWTHDYRSMMQTGKQIEKTALRKEISSAYIIGICFGVILVVWAIIFGFTVGGA